ncbi:hypothetical protein EIP86_008781 [Pleurotus ostreatoroseus]|nr:hypothetical protein EIP86_008781 [Pleurotus ostreatoroseus]
MPPTYCPCPRPILKRRSPSPTQDSAPPPTSPRDESAALLNIDPSVLHPLVHFAPPSALARTYAADSPAVYDRSPIVVAPNRCSLPARGCPGKTYLPGDEPERLAAAAAFAAARPRGGRRPRDASPAGRHSHPHSRAARAHVPHDGYDDDGEAPAVADTHPMPPLIPDGSSSSDSEESDGFVSPPLENTALASAPLYTTSLPYASPTPARTPGLSIPIPPDVSAAFSSMYLCPKPKPMTLPMPAPPSPLAFRSRLATYAPRASSPARPLSPTQSRSHSPCRDTSPTARRRRSHSKTKRVRGCPGELDAGYKPYAEQSVADEGCLGGF